MSLIRKLQILNSSDMDCVAMHIFNLSIIIFLIMSGISLVMKQTPLIANHYAGTNAYLLV